MDELSKSRVNITLDLKTNGADKKINLPLKMLMLGDFSNKAHSLALTKRQRIRVNKTNFDEVIKLVAPSIKLDIVANVNGKSEVMSTDLTFSSFTDFRPDALVKQIPALEKLLAMRNLLRELKSNLIDNRSFRNELQAIVQDEKNLNALCDELLN